MINTNTQIREVKMTKNEIIESIMEDENITRSQALYNYNESMEISVALENIDDGDYVENGNGWESSNFDGEW